MRLTRRVYMNEAGDGDGDGAAPTIGDAALDTKPEGGEKPEGDTKPDGEKPEGDTKPDGDKPDGEKPDGDDKKGEKDDGDGSDGDALRGVPEDGYAEVTMPDGFTLDDAGTERLTAVGDRFGLSQDGLQEVADFAAGWQAEQLQNLANAKVQEYNNNIEACQSDKEFGGEDYEKNIAAMGGVINRAFDGDTQAMNEFVEAIADVQVDPRFVRGFSRLMALIPAASDTFEDGKGKGLKLKSQVKHDSDSSRGTQLYGDMKK